MMKKKLETEHERERELEILKAVAQAWYGHSGSSRPTNEFDAHRRNFKRQPSRFRLEAMNKPASSSSSSSAKETASGNWDFRQSLWDSYEIVTVSKKLEAGLMFDNPFSGSDDPVRVRRRGRESKNSLRNLFNLFSSRRYDEAEVPQNDDWYSILISETFTVILVLSLLNVNSCYKLCWPETYSFLVILLLHLVLLSSIDSWKWSLELGLVSTQFRPQHLEFIKPREWFFWLPDLWAVLRYPKHINGYF